MRSLSLSPLSFSFIFPFLPPSFHVSCVSLRRNSWAAVESSIEVSWPLLQSCSVKSRWQSSRKNATLTVLALKFSEFGRAWNFPPRTLMCSAMAIVTHQLINGYTASTLCHQGAANLSFIHSSLVCFWVGILRFLLSYLFIFLSFLSSFFSFSSFLPSLFATSSRDNTTGEKKN